MENAITQLTSGVDLREVASAVESQYNLSRFLNLDADGAREQMCGLFNNQCLRFLDRMGRSEIWTPRWRTLLIDMEVDLKGPPEPSASGKTFKSIKTRPMALWGKYFHPHAALIKAKDERLFTSGVLEHKVPFLRRSLFDFDKYDLDYLARVYHTFHVKKDKKAASEISYYDKTRDDGSNDFMADEEELKKKRVPPVPEDVLDGYSHCLLECYEDSAAIDGLRDLIWSELANLDILYDFVANAKDEYLESLKQSIVNGIKECTSGNGTADVMKVIAKNVKGFRASIPDQEFSKFKGLMHGALKQNGQTLEKFVPVLMERLPAPAVQNLTNAFEKRTGRQVDRAHVALQVADSLRDMRMKDIPLEESIKQFAAKYSTADTNGANTSATAACAPTTAPVVQNAVVTPSWPPQRAPVQQQQQQVVQQQTVQQRPVQQTQQMQQQKVAQWPPQQSHPVYAQPQQQQQQQQQQPQAYHAPVYAHPMQTQQQMYAQPQQGYQMQQQQAPPHMMQQPQQQQAFYRPAPIPGVAAAPVAGQTGYYPSAPHPVTHVQAQPVQQRQQ